MVDRPFAAQVPPEPNRKRRDESEYGDSSNRQWPNEWQSFRHILCGDKIVRKIDILPFLPSTIGREKRSRTRTARSPTSATKNNSRKTRRNPLATEHLSF